MLTLPSNHYSIKRTLTVLSQDNVSIPGDLPIGSLYERFRVLYDDTEITPPIFHDDIDGERCVDGNVDSSFSPFRMTANNSKPPIMFTSPSCGSDGNYVNSKGIHFA